MGKSLHNTVSTSGGEVSPKLSARVDQQKYGTWLRQSRNMIPYRTGGLTRAPGTLQIAKAKYAVDFHNYCVRLISFKFSQTTTFMLEFGHRYVRFYSNEQQVELSSAPIWAVGTYVVGQFVEDPTDSNNIYICILGTAGPPSNFPPHTAPTYWRAQTIYEVVSPYTADAGSGSIYDTAVFKIVPCEINDVVYLAAPGYPVYSLTRFGDTNWVMKAVPFSVPPLLDPNASGITLSSDGTIGGVNITASAPAWATGTYYAIGRSVSNGGLLYTAIVSHYSSPVFSTDIALGNWELVDVFTIGNTGGYFRIGTILDTSSVSIALTADGTSSTIVATGACEFNTYGVWSATVTLQRSDDDGGTWYNVSTINSESDHNGSISINVTGQAKFQMVVSGYTASSGTPRAVFIIKSGIAYGTVKIDFVNSAYLANATVVSRLYSTAATTIWSEGAWSERRGYPQAVTSFQQRVIYGGSIYEPQRIWGTVTNDLENFDRGDATKATDSFAFDLNAPGRGPIQWLIAQGDMFVGFYGAEWVVNSGQTSSNQTVSGAAVTPTAINAVEQGSFGSQPYVQPAIVGNSAFFVQRQGDALRQLQFSFYTQKFQSQDMCSLADHLFPSRIAQITYQARWRHQGLVWVVTKQGTLCGLSYDLDGEIGGWCRRDTGYGQTTPEGAPIANDNGFESVSVIPSSGNDDDQVWVVTNRLVGGNKVRFIELVNPYNWEEAFTTAPNQPMAVLDDAYYVDCGVIVTSPGSRTFVVPQLANLVGRYVVGLADGNAFAPIQVGALGSITLSDSIKEDVGTVVVGLPIAYAGQPMRIDNDPRQGNTQALVKTLSDVFVRVYNSTGGSVSNGTINYPLWVSGTSYAVSDGVLSPANQQAYQCIAATSGATDPSLDATNWAPTPLPSYQQPVPLPYIPVNNSPFATRKLVTIPTDIRVPPQNMPSPGTDPVFIVTGDDARPLTVLGITLKYDIASTP